LIDGDGTVFKDELICNGEKGGREAAATLSNAINELVAERFPHLGEPRVIVRIYADIKSLSDLLVKAKIIDVKSIFEDFVRGFNGAKQLFDFVDAGTSKDAAGDKTIGGYRCAADDSMLTV